MSELGELIDEAKKRTGGKPTCSAVLVALTIEKGFDELISALNEGIEPLPDIVDELKGVRIAAEDLKL